MAVTCGEYETLREFFVNGYFVRGWDCAMTGGDVTVQLMFASVIFGGVGLSLFVTTGSLVIPSILAILFGGVILSLMPATFANIALVAVLLLLGGLGLLIAFRSGT
jgi:hypothetical protein